MTSSHVMKELMAKYHNLKKGLLFSLTVIGGGTVLFLAAAAALRIARHHAPDNVVELVSPDRRYRIVIVEEIAGFPGSRCIKHEVFAGGCQGLTDIRWNGNRIQGTVALGPAFENAKALKMKGFAADGKVALTWSAR